MEPRPYNALETIGSLEEPLSEEKGSSTGSLDKSSKPSKPSLNSLEEIFERKASKEKSKKEEMKEMKEEMILETKGPLTFDIGIENESEGIMTFGAQENPFQFPKRNSGQKLKLSGLLPISTRKADPKSGPNMKIEDGIRMMGGSTYSNKRVEIVEDGVDREERLIRKRKLSVIAIDKNVVGEFVKLIDFMIESKIKLKYVASVTYIKDRFIETLNK